MWSYKDGDLDTGVFDEKKITNEITGEPQGKYKLPKDVNNAKLAMQKLRGLMGARKYMRDENIAKIFGKQVSRALRGSDISETLANNSAPILQVNRMGDMIDKLDKALEQQTRTGRGTGTYTPWKRQQLKAFWDEYMNERFLVAKTRTFRDMDNYIALLNTHWGKNAPMRNEIAKLKAEWTKEKAIEWVRPW